MRRAARRRGRSGWSVALATLGLFVVVELVAAHWSSRSCTGYHRPFAALRVIAASLERCGADRLDVSTPLTLCLLGRRAPHKALSCSILVGDTQALTASASISARYPPIRNEIIASAREFLKRNPSQLLRPGVCGCISPLDLLTAQSARSSKHGFAAMVAVIAPSRRSPSLASQAALQRA